MNVPYHTSWVTRLPRGLQEQPAWVFIGTLVALAGMSYLLGFSESTTVARVLTASGIRLWGGFLCISGVLVIGSTITSNKPLERLSLRFLSLGLLVYMGWVLSAVSWDKATFTVISCLALICTAEIRVALIRRLLKPLPHIAREEED